MNSAGIRTVLAAVAALMMAACETQVPRPGFVARSLQDCENGDEAACAMLDSLLPARIQAENGDLAPRPQTQAEKNADAILEGIRRAKSLPPAQGFRIAPTTRRDL